MSEPKDRGIRIRMYEIDDDGTKREVPMPPLPPSRPPAPPRTGVHTRGTVEVWHRKEGWGVVASDRTPGGCWVHFSHVTGAGFRTLTVGQVVDLEFEDLGGRHQGGYRFRAISVSGR